MSRENVENHRRGVDAVNRRDLDALLNLTDTDVEAESRLVAVEGGYRGHEGMRRWWQNVFEAFPDYTVEALEVRDLGELTLATVRTQAHGAGGAVPVTETLWMPAKWRDARIVRWATYRTEAEALEALRLWE